MDYQKIKKAQSSLMGLVVTMVIVIGIFTGFFLWMQDMASSSGITIDSKYNSTYNKLLTQQSSLSNNVNDIQDSITNVHEADNALQVAWNGLKGLGSVLLLPISFVSTSIDVYTTIIDPIDFIPIWVKILAPIGIIAFVVFLVLSNLKGEPKLIN